MTEVRIGVVGTGFIATNFAKSLDRHPAYTVGRVLSRRDTAEIAGFPEGVLTNSTTDLTAGSDIVVECSGDPLWATEVVGEALASDLAVVTMNTEFHITTGSAFVGKGMVTEAEGDQPGCQAALHEDAIAMGFEPIAYGNMKGFLNHDPEPSDMEFWGAKQGISLPMVTSFTDGTKVQAEQILVGNHYGATIAAEGMLGPDVADLDEAAKALTAAADDVGRPIADFVVGRSLSHGVFIVARHAEDQRDALEYYKMGPGPEYVLVRPNIIVHLEILKTVRRALGGGPVLLDNSATPELSLAAVAKRDLAPGEPIENAIGSFALRGHTVRITERPEHIPMGLIRDATVVAPVERGEMINTSHLELPETTARALWEREILPSAT